MSTARACRNRALAAFLLSGTVGLLACTVEREGLGAGDGIRLEPSRMVGQLEGPLAFSLIGDLAIHPAGILAIVDLQACEIAILELERLTLLRRFGRCGDGPGEFRFIQDITFVGDSLFVFDQRTRQIIVLDMEGNEGRRMRPPVLGQPPVLLLTDMSAVNDSTVLVGLALMPASGESRYPGESDHLLLAFMDVRTGAIGARFYRDSELSIANRNNAIRGVSACAAPTTPHLIATLNRWEFAGTFHNPPDTAATAQFRSEVDWIVPHETEPGEWIWPGVGSVACAADVALFSYLGSESEPRRWTRGHVELRRYDGSLLYQRTLTDADSVFFGRGAGLRGRFYLASNSVFDYPVIHEIVIRRE